MRSERSLRGKIGTTRARLGEIFYVIVYNGQTVRHIKDNIQLIVITQRGLLEFLLIEK